MDMLVLGRLIKEFRGMDTLKGGNSVKIVLPPFLKRFDSKRKEFTPKLSF